MPFTYFWWVYSGYVKYSCCGLIWPLTIRDLDGSLENSVWFEVLFFLEEHYLMESEQIWRPLYCMEKSRVQTKMAETYCYLEEQLVDDNLQVVNPFLSRQLFLFDCSCRLVFWLLCIDVNGGFKLALEYTGNVDGSLLSIDQRIPCEILLDFDSSFQLNFAASKGLISVS